MRACCGTRAYLLSLDVAGGRDVRPRRRCRRRWWRRGRGGRRLWNDRGSLRRRRCRCGRRCRSRGRRRSRSRSRCWSRGGCRRIRVVIVICPAREQHEGQYQCNYHNSDRVTFSHGYLSFLDTQSEPLSQTTTRYRTLQRMTRTISRTIYSCTDMHKADGSGTAATASWPTCMGESVSTP